MDEAEFHRTARGFNVWKVEKRHRAFCMCMCIYMYVYTNVDSFHSDLMMLAAIINAFTATHCFCGWFLARTAPWPQFFSFLFSLARVVSIFFSALCCCHRFFSIFQLTWIIIRHSICSSIWNRVWYCVHVSVSWRYGKIETEITFYEKTVCHLFIRHADGFIFLCCRFV